MFNVSISTKNNEVSGEFVVDSYFFEPAKYTYAFYLYKNGERIDVAWYGKNMEANFDVKDMTGEFYIKVFIKDIERGDARSYISEEIFISN